MSKYRHDLPQLSGNRLLTDGGLETTLVFHDAMELPYFAAFTLMEEESGRDRLKRYFTRYIEVARQHGVGFVLDTPTWRANPDWAAKLGYDADRLADLNRRCVAFLVALRWQMETARTPIVINGVIGPRGDGYQPDRLMSAIEAEAYHAAQVKCFAGTETDMISAITMNYAEEAIGIARAASKAGMPVAISFTVETDGRLPTGQTLRDAIAMVDRETGKAPAYYMINCAHPTHFEGVLAEKGDWLGRIRGLRANASALSHAELDAATALDDGNPQELGGQYRNLLRILDKAVVLGGCCGTDHRHIEQIAGHCLAETVAA